jgi:DNA (cytosine-5)-methyltransferase 1
MVGVRKARSTPEDESQAEPKIRVAAVDLFAGPGGLSEGFASVGLLYPEISDTFETVLAYERDEHATRTLRFRKLHHACGSLGKLPAYFRAVSENPREPEAALPEDLEDLASDVGAGVKCVQLERSVRDVVSREVRAATKGRPWVLLGGPPCQAYSLVGRVRNRGVADYNPVEDERHTLYEEYLHVLATAGPDAFVLENVKGLLSATVENRWILGKMTADLSGPGKALGLADAGPSYRLYSLMDGRELRVSNWQQDMLSGDRGAGFADLRATVVRMEEYGVPQARHRVLILGIRSDLRAEPRPLRPSAYRVPIEQVIGDLPALRSRFSDRPDSEQAWLRFVRTAPTSDWREQLRLAANGNARGGIDELRRLLQRVEPPEAGIGGAVVLATSAYRRNVALIDDAAKSQLAAAWNSMWRRWFRTGLRGQTWYSNHESRSHMASDLHRYLFAACFAWVGESVSPTLRDFPRTLLPRHRNVLRAVRDGLFADRFRVQVKGRPATTITSHIHKDGHYFIHFDPTQVRSLSVREAARVQTFPDSYIFLGPRTEQFRQVGNAVPPYLAAQVAEVVFDVLRQAKRI